MRASKRLGEIRGYRITLLALSALALAGCGENARTTRASPSVLFADRLLVIAHRGGARLRPEHTLVAYQNALDVGADVVELDLHATADGVVVCLHDTSVDRTTDGTGVVRQMPYDAVRRLDAGYRFTRDGGATYPWRGKGLTIPTLDEALDLLGNTPLSVEFKQASPSIVESTLATFAARGTLANAVFVSFDTRPLVTTRALQPTALTAFSTQEMAAFALLTDATVAAYEPPGPFIQPPAELVNPAFMARVRQVGLRVHPWTVNDRDEMQRLIDLGVDGIFTDDPVMLKALLAETAGTHRAAGVTAAAR